MHATLIGWLTIGAKLMTVILLALVIRGQVKRRKQFEAKLKKYQQNGQDNGKSE